MKTNELSVGKVLVATTSAKPYNSYNNYNSYTATTSAEASASASPSIGSAVLPAGQTSVFINNNQITAQSKVFVTSETPIAQTLAVTEETEGVGFKVEIKLPEVSDVKFSYWIIN